MSRPSPDSFPARPPRVCHHVMVEYRDGTERRIGAFDSVDAAEPARVHAAASPDVVAAWVDARYFCNCPTR